MQSTNYDLAIISDFSKTLTSANCPSTWSVLVKSKLLPDEYIRDRNDLYDLYYHFEVEGNKPKTVEWFEKHIELFPKYKLSKDIIKQVVSSKSFFEPRNGLVEFLSSQKLKSVDRFVINTSGFKDFIEAFFEFYNINYSQIEIFGNEFIFNDLDLVIGNKQVYSPLNKTDFAPDLSKYKKVILLGDSKEDLDMCNGENVFKIGFCEESIKGYDVYLGKDGNLEEVLKYL